MQANLPASHSAVPLLNACDLPVRPKVVAWQKDAHAKLVSHQLDELQGVREQALRLAAASTAAHEALEGLLAQADNMEILSAACLGEAQPSGEVVEEAMQGAQVALEAYQAALASLRLALPSDASSDLCGQLHQSALPLITALNRASNLHRCPLLSLPQALLSVILREAGPASRLACHHAADAYGSPGTTLVWDAGRLPPSMPHAAQMEHLAALLTGWRWGAHVQELRLPTSATLNEATCRVLAAALPNLQRLGSCTAARSGLPGPGPAASTPPTLPRLTSLRCTVPVMVMSAVLPFALPALRCLDVRVEDAQCRGLGALLRPLAGLTHLHLDVACALPAATAQELWTAVCDLSGTLRSLRVGRGSVAEALPPEVLAGLPLLESLTVDGSYWDDRLALPPLRQLAALRHLRLAGPEIWVRSVEPLAAVLAGGSDSLQELHLPLLQLRDASFAPRVAAAVLQRLWQRLPQVTSLSVGCLAGQASHWQPDSLVPVGRTPWLPGVEAAAALRQLSLAMDVLQLPQVACLQALPALTSLELCLLGDLLLSPVAAEAVAGCAVELGRLGGLRSLRLGMRGGAVEVRTSVLAVALQGVREAAGLPGLRSLDVVGLGPLRDAHAVHLLPLLAPTCGVRRLAVHDATGSRLPGVGGQAALEALVACRGGEAALLRGDGSGVVDPRGLVAGGGGGPAEGRSEDGILPRLLQLQGRLELVWSNDKGQWFA